MSFPLMNKRARQGVSIPELSGGLNLRDSVSMVNDNQLTDAVNMWFKDGVLKTRPGIEAKDILTKGRITSYENRFFKIHSDITSSEGTLISYFYLFEKTVTISFWWLDTDVDGEDESFFKEAGYTSITIPEGEKETENNVLTLPKVNHFIIKNKDDFYCFVRVEPNSGDKIYKIYKYDPSKEEDGIIIAKKWQELKSEDMHIPEVLVHCVRDGWSFEGTQFDGYNLLTDGYKMIYSAYNEYDSDENHPMRYPLKESISINTKLTIKVEITTSVAGITLTNTHILKSHNSAGETRWGSDTMGSVLYEDVDATDYQNYDGIYVLARTNYIAFKTKNDADDPIYLNNEQNIAYYAPCSDNIKISVIPDDVNPDRADKVFAMTQSKWFGRASLSANNGSCLFLCGNSKEKNLVVWSAQDNPLYFNENCYAYIGDKEKSVTGFGKQSDMLVIFKEDETYFTQYNQNDNITAEDLIDQTVVDYTANSVYFPLALIHSSIGCDLPTTIQLCRNRLVWANSNGKVYTLTSANQYSERNIYEVGEMIERRLRDDITYGGATSFDFNGHYILFVNNHAYLMDYNSSGYQYAYSYQKNEDANIKIPWGIWEFRFDDFCDIVPLKDQNYFVVSGYKNTNDTEAWYSALYRFSYDGTDNIYNITGTSSNVKSEKQHLPIHSSLTTKLFDFGMAGYRKNVDLVQLSLGNNGGAPINVDFVTDCGTVSEEVTLTSDETENYTAGYVSSVGLNPSIRSVLRFGVRLTCEGKLAVDGMSLNYRILGGAR